MPQFEFERAGEEEEGSGVAGVALIGTGRCGRVHLRNAVGNPRLAVRWLVDVNDKIVSAVKREFNLDCQTATYDNIHDALQDAGVDLIVITTPTDNHAKMIEVCIKEGRGQAILCEKPISEEPEEIEHCYKLAKDAGVQLMCGFNRRFDPTFCRAEELVRTEVGRIQTMHAVYADAPTPPLYFLQANHESRRGVIFYDLGCHFIDLILWLLQEEEPESVYAVAHTNTDAFKSMNEPDLCMCTLNFSSATVVMELGYSSGVGFDQRLEIRGTEGVVQANNPEQTAVRRITPGGRVSDALESSIWSRFRESFYREMDFMADVALGKAEVCITGEHCVKVERVAEALRQSYFQNKPVHLKESQGEV